MCRVVEYFRWLLTREVRLLPGVYKENSGTIGTIVVARTVSPLDYSMESYEGTAHLLRGRDGEIIGVVLTT